MVKENNNNNFALIALVAIVAVVGMVGLMMFTGGKSSSSEILTPSLQVEDTSDYYSAQTSVIETFLNSDTMTKEDLAYSLEQLDSDGNLIGEGFRSPISFSDCRAKSTCSWTIRRGCRCDGGGAQTVTKEAPCEDSTLVAC